MARIPVNMVRINSPTQGGPVRPRHRYSLRSSLTMAPQTSPSRMAETSTSSRRESTRARSTRTSSTTVPVTSASVTRASTARAAISHRETLRNTASSVRASNPNPILTSWGDFVPSPPRIPPRNNSRATTASSSARAPVQTSRATTASSSARAPVQTSRATTASSSARAPVHTSRATTASSSARAPVQTSRATTTSSSARAPVQTSRATTALSSAGAPSLILRATTASSSARAHVQTSRATTASSSARASVQTSRATTTSRSARAPVQTSRATTVLSSAGAPVPITRETTASRATETSLPIFRETTASRATGAPDIAAAVRAVRIFIQTPNRNSSSRGSPFFSPLGISDLSSIREFRDTEASVDMAIENLEATLERRLRDAVESPRSRSRHARTPQENVPQRSLESYIFGRVFCPVCFGDLLKPDACVQATQCGHIFCHTCVLQVMSHGGKCPTCRMNIKSHFPIYIPIYSDD